MAIPLTPFEEYEQRQTPFQKPWTNREVNKVLKQHGIKRVGRCDSNKCGAACCRVMCTHDGVAIGDEIDCSKLVGNNCGIQGLKPAACAQFPISPNDGVYKHVRLICSYRFVYLTGGRVPLENQVTI